LPSHRPRGLAATSAVHAAAVSALLLSATLSRLAPAGGPAVVPVTVGAAVVKIAPPPPVLEHAGFSLDVPETEPSAATAAAPDAFAFDTTAIRAHRDTLFPFVTARLAFLDALQAALAADRQRLHDPLGRGASTSESPPLTLAPGRLDAMLDAAWSRRERWTNFAPIARLATGYDPDRGHLPALVRGYVDRNLLQPYVETTPRDERFWVMLNLSAGHTDLLEFIGRYVRAHPSSRTTTELLFLLDELAQANRDALTVLLLTDPQQHLGRTRAASQSNYDLAVALQRGYRGWLEEHGLDRPANLDARFDEVRLRILSTIVESSPGGYGAADARFLAGRILWDRGDTAGAVAMWRGTTSDDRDSYAAPRAGIAAALRGNGADVVEIVRVLGAERGRWLRQSAARLARFGYRPDTF